MLSRRFKTIAVVTCATAGLIGPAPSSAQVVGVDAALHKGLPSTPQPYSGNVQPSVPAQPPVAPNSVPRTVLLPEGSEIEVAIVEQLSSGTNTDGDRFTIRLADPITLSDGTVIPAGYKGKGTVTHAEKRGFIGKAGELNVTFDYIRVGSDRIRLRANKSSTGKGSLGSAVALTVIFGPLGLLARGANIVIPSGQTITTYVDSDAHINVPIGAPPPDDED